MTNMKTLRMEEENETLPRILRDMLIDKKESQNETQ